MRTRLFVALLTVALLIMLPVLTVSGQVKQPAEWITAKRLTVATRADIGTTLTAATVAATTLTADTASFTTLTAPTVTMTSATTWTVASLTATNLGATTATLTTAALTTAALTTANVGALNVSGLTKLTGNTLITGTLGVAGATTMAAVGAGAVTATGLQVNGSGNITGHFDVLDYASVSGKFYLIPPAAQTVIDGGTITGTSGIIEVTATGEVTASLVAAGAGQVLTIVNTGAEIINIADAGTTKLAGALALGPDDTVSLVGIGVSWYEVSRSAN